MSILAAPTSRQSSTPRRRSADRRSLYPYVRAVRGKTGTWVWQARAWLGRPDGSVNLGCYRQERAAWAAARAWIRAGADPCRHLPAGVLPKWVRKRPQDGLFDAVRRTASGERIVAPGGPYATPAAAHAAARLSADADWERHLRRRAARDAQRYREEQEKRERVQARPEKRTGGAKAKRVRWPEAAGRVRPAFFQPTPFAKWEC